MSYTTTQSMPLHCLDTPYWGSNLGAWGVLKTLELNTRYGGVNNSLDRPVCALVADVNPSVCCPSCVHISQVRTKKQSYFTLNILPSWRQDPLNLIFQDKNIPRQNLQSCTKSALKYKPLKQCDKNIQLFLSGVLLIIFF